MIGTHSAPPGAHHSSSSSSSTSSGRPPTAPPKSGRSDLKFYPAPRWKVISQGESLSPLPDSVGDALATLAEGRARLARHHQPSRYSPVRLLGERYLRRHAQTSIDQVQERAEKDALRIMEAQRLAGLARLATSHPTKSQELWRDALRQVAQTSICEVTPFDLLSAPREQIRPILELVAEALAVLADDFADYSALGPESQARHLAERRLTAPLLRQVSAPWIAGFFHQPPLRLRAEMDPSPTALAVGHRYLNWLTYHNDTGVLPLEFDGLCRAIAQTVTRLILCGRSQELPFQKDSKEASSLLEDEPVTRAFCDELFSPRVPGTPLVYSNPEEVLALLDFRCSEAIRENVFGRMFSMIDGEAQSRARLSPEPVARAFFEKAISEKREATGPIIARLNWRPSISGSAQAVFPTALIPIILDYLYAPPQAGKSGAPAPS